MGGESGAARSGKERQGAEEKVIDAVQERHAGARHESFMMKRLLVRAPGRGRGCSRGGTCAKLWVHAVLWSTRILAL